MKDLKRWKTLQSETLLHRPPWLKVISDQVELPDGRIVAGYLRLETPDYVVIVGVNNQRDFVLIRSYKHGLGAVDIQPAAGYLEAGEDPLSAAQREFQEETGCRAQHWHPLGSYILAGNRGAGRAHIFLATGCEVATQPESGDLEEQEVLWMPADQVRERLHAGSFKQLASVASLSLALMELDSR